MDLDTIRRNIKEMSDLDLIRAFQTPSDYSSDSQTIIAAEVEARGGPESLSAKVKKALIVENHKAVFTLRLQQKLLQGQALDMDELLEGITALSEAEIAEIMEKVCSEWEKQAIKEKTTLYSFIMGLIGAVIGAAVGAPIFAFMIMGSGKIFIFGFAILALISYSCVWLFSRKDFRNIGTVLLSLVSTVAALFLGLKLFQILGPEGYVQFMK